MERLKFKEVTLHFVDGTAVKYENCEFSQKGAIMFFEFPNGRNSIVNFDNLTRMIYVEAEATEE